MAKPSIEALLLDVDGTLLSSMLTISKANASSISQLHNAGIRIFLASGRPMRSLAKIVKKLSLEPFVIALNGGCVVDIESSDVIFSLAISHNFVATILSIALEFGVSPSIYTPRDWYVERIDDNVKLEMNRSDTEPKIMSFNQNIEPVIKILFIGEQEALSKCEQKLSTQPEIAVNRFHTYPEYLEIIAIGASKGRARDELLKRLNIPLDKIIAVGDGINDISLLKDAGISVAVKNAHDAVRKVADYITLSNDNDGVAVAINALVFGDNTSNGFLNKKSSN